MKLKTVFFSILLITVTATFGQTKKQMQFIGYNLVQYKQYVKVSDDKYKALFKNMGGSMEQGRIVVDESTKTFTVKWLNGNDWECKYTKKETKNEHNDFFGAVENTTYTGKWTDNNFDCILLITVTKSDGCVFTVKSKKVVDQDFGIDTWNKVFTFGNSGKCFE